MVYNKDIVIKVIYYLIMYYDLYNENQQNSIYVFD